MTMAVAAGRRCNKASLVYDRKSALELCDSSEKSITRHEAITGDGGAS